MRNRLFVAVLFLVASTLGCSSAGFAGNDNPAGSDPIDGKYRVEVVASGLEVPWGFAWLPGGNILFTERPGRVRIIEKGQLRAEPVFTVPDVEPSGESGLMDITLHPSF